MRRETSHVIFRDPGQLVQALGVFGLPFPSRIIRTGGGRWALEVFADRSQLSHMSVQHKWQVEFVSEPPRGTQVPFYEILSAAKWVYCDPVCLDLDLSHGVHFRQRSATMWNDEKSSFNSGTSYEGPQYLLGARDKEHARQLLDALTNSLALGIKALPLIFEGVSKERSFRYFWLVTGSRPDLNLLHTAERAWWGPVRDGAVKIFLEWPFRIDFPEDCLNAMDWGIETGVILLSQSQPTVLRVRRRAGEPEFAELTEVAELSSQKHQQVVVDSIPDRPTQEFRVQLRLIQADQRQSTADRIEQLKREILLRERIRKSLEEYASPFQKPDLAFEPLYLYYDDGRGIPFELRRLLLEWSDQPEELRSLRYMVLDAKSFPIEGLDGSEPREEMRIHLLTTATALGESGPSGLGVRLAEYRPSGAYSNFELLVDWAQFGLHVFVPAGHRTELYPVLTPGQFTAEMLAKALLPGAAKDWAVLLIPAPQSQVAAVQLPLADFKPLFSTFEWDCNLAMSMQPDQIRRAAEDTAKESRNAILTGIGQAFESAIEKEARQRLSAREADLLQDIESRREEFEERKKRTDSVGAWLEKYEHLVVSLEELAQQTADLNHTFQGGLQERFAIMVQAGDAQHSLDIINQTLQKQRNELGTLVQRLEEVRQLTKSLGNWQNKETADAN